MYIPLWEILYCWRPRITLLRCTHCTPIKNKMVRVYFVSASKLRYKLTYSSNLNTTLYLIRCVFILFTLRYWRAQNIYCKIFTGVVWEVLLSRQRNETCVKPRSFYVLYIYMQHIPRYKFKDLCEFMSTHSEVKVEG